MPDLRCIVGTAGHVDHGKTRLIEALTGIDCDRWAEEKSRGITIDLGFAHLERDGVQLGFIDVPGHQRFLHNALAGLGGVRVLLLVVAADEGVKPQTREHLAIASLLQIPAAVVALTKIDAVDGELCELARLEVEELLSATSFAGASVLPVSALSGEGLDDLSATLLELARRHAVVTDERHRARLPIDRAFHLRGLGAIVTGTLVSGRIGVGDELSLLPGDERVRVRSIQVHGSSRPEARNGERTSLQLAGISLDLLRRGQTLATPGQFAAHRHLAARLTLLADAPKVLSGWTPIRAHLYAEEVTGRLRPLLPSVLPPGGEGIAELQLDTPVVATRQDRLILRRPSPAATLGGGVVLDPCWPRPRGRRRQLALESLAEPDTALLSWTQEGGLAGATASGLAPRLGVPPDELAEHLQSMAKDGRLLLLPQSSGREPRFVVPDTFRRLEKRARQQLGSYFREHRLADGMPKAEAIQTLLGNVSSEISAVYLDWLAARKVLSVDGDRIVEPGRQATLSGDELRLADRLLSTIEKEGLTPPSPGELAARLDAKPQIVEGILKLLESRKQVIRLPGGLLLSATAIDRLIDDLRAQGWTHFQVPQFKDHFGLSRKWAIPLLEHLDSRGVTRRVGDGRQVVRA